MLKALDMTIRWRHLQKKVDHTGGEAVGRKDGAAAMAAVAGGVGADGREERRHTEDEKRKSRERGREDVQTDSEGGRGFGTVLWGVEWRQSINPDRMTRTPNHQRHPCNVIIVSVDIVVVLLFVNVVAQWRPFYR